jgi:hypothetical protein
MLRLRVLWPALLAAVALVNGRDGFGQTTVLTGAAPEPVFGNQPLPSNTFQAGKAVAAVNKVIQPIPLSANERDMALDGIDRHLADQVAQLKEKLKIVLPDELGVLAKTAGWRQEHQNALLIALRAGDPAAVYEAWTQGNPQDAGGAEIVARQTEVKRTFLRLEQNVKNKVPIKQNLDDLAISMEKIAASTPALTEIEAAIDTMKTWAEVRKLVESANPEVGPIAKLPSGKVPLVFDPSLAVGTVVVLSNNTVLIGNEGRGALSITTGNACEALGLPLVTGAPVADAEGQEMVSGILLVNPRTSRNTIEYNVNGNHYISEPGMAQRLPDGAQWTVEYDRGQGAGPAIYSVTAGTYYFTPTDHGWQLYRQRFDVVLDNTESSQEFNFLYNGRRMVVPANGNFTLTSIYPMVIRYDRGNGTELAAKSLNFAGTVQIGVNANDNMWDIFPTTENQREIIKLRLFD